MSADGGSLKRKIDQPSDDMGNRFSSLSSKKKRSGAEKEPAKPDEPVVAGSPEPEKPAADDVIKIEEPAPVDDVLLSEERAVAGADTAEAEEDAPPPLERQDDAPSEKVPEKKTEPDSPIVEEVKQELEKGQVRRSKRVAKKKTIADLGYRFNEEGQLRTIEGDGPFKFTTQAAYEELGELIGEEVYDLMEAAGLVKKYLVKGGSRRFFFVSPDYDKKETVLVLIHGSGVVKAGQWARKLIINESLSRGTQLDYIKRALNNDWGVVVLNYNEHCVGQKKGCHSPNAHGTEEWRTAFPLNLDTKILVVAHSFGGQIISDQVKRMARERDDRLRLVTLTDSWFCGSREVFSVNWCTREQKAEKGSGDVWQLFAGDRTHEGTSAAAINSIFHLLEGYDDSLEYRDLLNLLLESEKIIIREWRAKQRAKREEKGETASNKSLEFEETKIEEKKEAKEKSVKKEDRENNGKEGVKKEESVEKEEEDAAAGDQKEDESGKEEEEEESEKKVDAKEEKMEQEEEKKESGDAPPVLDTSKGAEQ